MSIRTDAPDARGADRGVMEMVRQAGLWLVVTALVWVAVPALVGRFAEKGDANIGLGLLMFAALVVVGLVGGLVSGRAVGFGRAAGLWVLLAGGVAVWTSYRLATEEGGFDGSVFGAELGSTGVFVGVLLAVPALLAAGSAEHRAGHRSH